MPSRRRGRLLQGRCFSFGYGRGGRIGSAQAPAAEGQPPVTVELRLRVGRGLHLARTIAPAALPVLISVVNAT
jgi:hypothetical protein